MDPLPARRQLGGRVDRKRRDQKPRVLLSCTSCREKKLKCNRQTPCDNCHRRGLGEECHYSGAKPNSQHQNGSHNSSHNGCKAQINALEMRLRQLEAVIRNQQTSQETITTPHSVTMGQSAKTGIQEVFLADRHEPDVMLSESAGIRSFNQNHWRAIMKSATRDINENDDGRFQTGVIETPILLRGTSGSANIEDLLRELPPRHVADVLALQYLDSAESSLIIIHVPTFKEEYENFWANPSDASRAWLALLFGVLSCGMWIEHTMNPDTAETDPPEIFDHYKRVCCIALIGSSYSTPGRYKVEAATLYLGLEYLSSDGLKTSVSILASIVTRIAIMMGYHRDPVIYPHLSTFEGEMRRRLWLILSMIDYFVAWQSGLPTVIPMGISDTAPPHVLFDSDFCSQTEVLPSSSPDAEVSSNINYVIAQERLLLIANTISRTSDTHPQPEKTIYFEAQLETVWGHVPDHLKESTVSNMTYDTMIRILTLEMTYQRARCILHRPYLVHSRDEPAFKLFRIECVHAAQRILHCQIELFQGIFSQPQCRHRVWFGISRSVCDCLTAAMVISLEILSRFKSNELVDHGSSEELIQTLKASRTSWKQCPRLSPETAKAAKILDKMLALISSHDKRAHRQVTGSSVMYSGDAHSFVDEGQELFGEPTLCSSSSLIESQEIYTNIAAFDMIDFTLWDQEMQNLSHISIGSDERKNVID